MLKITTIAASLAALTLAACGTTDHGGYASEQEACTSLGAQVAKGPIIEADEVEFLCTNGKTVEAQRSHVRGPQAKSHTNAWGVDEDSITCADGTEITVGDEAVRGYDGNLVDSCESKGGVFGGGN